MKVTSVNEFLSYYKDKNEIPSFDLDNDADEGLANELMQIRLGIMEDNHYVPLTKLMLERHIATDVTPSSTVVAAMEKSRNRIINLSILLGIKLTDEMIMYYCSRSCEELGIGDMASGTENTDDDWYIVKLYQEVQTKAQMYNLYAWTTEQNMALIDIKLQELIAKRDLLNVEISTLILKRYQFIDELATVPKKS